MAAAAADSSSDGPVLTMFNKRLRALRKKQNRISQMEDALSQGKPLNREQEEVLRSKPAVLALIDDYEKLRAPLTAALNDEIALHSPTPATSSPPPPPPPSVEDIIGLLYFSRLFDVQTQSEFTATMLTRTHERGCCLTYDYVTDDAVDLLGEHDLDHISALGALVSSRPAAAAVSHKSALEGCVEHAKRWLANADEPICPGASVTYAGLREKLGKIMASDYCTATPEMKAPDDVAAAVGMYNNACQVQAAEVGEAVGSEGAVDGSVVSSEIKEDEEENLQETEVTADQSSEPSQNDEELPQDESDGLNPAGDTISDHPEQQNLEADQEHNIRDTETRGQQHTRRPYPNQRGGYRGGGGFGGRRGYPNGRGGRPGRGGGGGGGGVYQNGRGQFYDNGYSQRNFYNTRGRGGGRFGGPGMGNNYGPATQGVPAYAE